MAKHPSSNSGAGKPQYQLHLYISGATPRSQRALANLKHICDQHLKGRYDLRVTDIFQNPEQIAEADVIAAPTLIKTLPLPVRRFIGDLSDTDKVVVGLAITKPA
jgi:circadian clock protein KaiB